MAISPSLSYLRLFLLIVSWHFSAEHPAIFLSCFLGQHTLYILQMLTKGDKEKQYHYMLRLCISHTATAILIFATIAQTLRHYSENSLLHKSEESNTFCFILTCIFFIDFISAWFDLYSKCFAGDRMDKVSNFVERIL